MNMNRQCQWVSHVEIATQVFIATFDGRKDDIDASYAAGVRNGATDHDIWCPRGSHWKKGRLKKPALELKRFGGTTNGHTAFMHVGASLLANLKF